MGTREVKVGSIRLNRSVLRFFFFCFSTHFEVLLYIVVSYRNEKHFIIRETKEEFITVKG